MRCYICNKELADNPAENSHCKAHGEHIIHNGIRGKLISKHILCEKCGNDYSKEDAAFCSIFAPFIVMLKNRLIPADHGKDTPKTLPGKFFDSPTSNSDEPSRLVNAKDGVVTPVEPYYKIEGDTITVYAEKRRVNQYINVLNKHLKAEGKDIVNYTVEKVTDIHDKGYLAYFFSEGNATFNDDFKKGIVKIAAEYAIHCGVPRDQLTDVLTINDEGIATLDCTNTTMFPFVPTLLFDVLFEDCRYFFEDGYPSHTLRLFSVHYNNDTSSLYCYVDLFSTFQYYVLLNGDYKGKEVNETYAQRLLQEEKYDVSSCDYSDLDIFIRKYGIDMKRCVATAYEDQLRHVQECIRKYPPQAYDLQTVLGNACEKIQSISHENLYMGKVSKELYNMLCKQLKVAYDNKVVERVKACLTNLTKHMDIAETIKTINAFTDSVKIKYYRKLGFDVIDGEVASFSIPEESMKVLVEHKDIVKEYTNVKFSHLAYLCNNICRKH